MGYSAAVYFHSSDFKVKSWTTDRGYENVGFDAAELGCTSSKQSA